MEGESFVEDVVPESGADTLKRITVSVLQGAEDTSENRLCLRSGSFRIRRRASASESGCPVPGVLRKPIWMPPLSGAKKGGQNRNNQAGQGDETHEPGGGTRHSSGGVYSRRQCVRGQPGSSHVSHPADSCRRSGTSANQSPLCDRRQGI
jgi:hypothetical protein